MLPVTNPTVENVTAADVGIKRYLDHDVSAHCGHFITK